MTGSEITRLLNNCDDDQLELLANIALRFAKVKADRWTGHVTFVVHAHMGAVGDMQVNHGEVVRLTKKRTVRSRGL